MSSPNPLADYVRMSAVDDLSYPLACDDRTRDAVHTIVSGRKSWKTLKGKGEAVWPPYLEAALVEALDKYRPETSRSQRSLSRFPNRNRFISDYIFHVTGKRRTAKQVGSRLQQLRDTCGGKRILKLLSNRDFSSADESHEHSSTSLEEGTSDGASTISDSSLTSGLLGHSRPSRALVYIDVLPAHTPWSPAEAAGVAGGIVLGSMNPPVSPAGPASAIVFRSPKARPLRAIDPTVTFTASNYISAQSNCSVYYNGNCIGTDLTELTCAQTDAGAGPTMFLYRTALVPQYWQRLCDSSDPGRYSIVQEIVQNVPGAPVQNVLLTVVYQLNEPGSSAGSSPALSTASPSDISSPFSFTNCDPALLHELPISPISSSFGDHSPGSAAGGGDLFAPPPLDDAAFAHMSPLAIDDFDPVRWAYPAPHAEVLF